MRAVLAPLMILTLLTAALPVAADDSEIGRYQAIKLDNTEFALFSVFIIDTKEGHLWVSGVNKTGEIFSLHYMGKVRPGKKIGEVIEQESKLKPMP